jgi:ubiquinone/menaquinone biosynthesis C-methylase UbiE
MNGVVNADQFAAWNGDSGRRWAEDPDRRDRVLAPVAEALYASVGLRPGESVIDLGCGCGATTLDAAYEVGAAGTAYGIDLSDPMLDVARHRARDRELANIRFEYGDAQTHRFPAAGFDVALSRFGTMFFADQVAAFTNVARALRPGGRMSLATWQPMIANDWLTVPGAVLLRYGTLPAAPEGPGMFAQSDPDELIHVLTAAGFESVQPSPVTISLQLGANAADAVDYLAASGPGQTILNTIPHDLRPTAISAVQATLEERLGPRGVELGAAIWVTEARWAPAGKGA